MDHLTTSRPAIGGATVGAGPTAMGGGGSCPAAAENDFLGISQSGTDPEIGDLRAGTVLRSVRRCAHTSPDEHDPNCRDWAGPETFHLRVTCPREPTLVSPRSCTPQTLSVVVIAST